MTVVTSAGTIVSIGTKAANPVGDSYTEIGEVVNLPEFGKVYNLITHNPLNNRKTFKFKGSFNEGSLAMDIARDPSDAGQAAARAALDDDDAYNFEIQLNDADDVTGSTPTTLYFKGKVMSYTTNVQSVDSIVGSTLTIEIDGDITEVAAS